MNVETGNTNYVSYDGVLFKQIAGGLQLQYYPIGRAGADYQIPEAVDETPVIAIWNTAFGQSRLTSIEIPGSITEITDNTFSNNTYLEKIKISEGVTKIGLMVFWGCSSIKSIVIPSSIAYLGDFSFFNCPQLISVTFVGETSPNTHYGEYVFGLSDENSEFGYHSDSELSIYVPNGCVDTYKLAVNSGDVNKIKELPPTTSAADGIKLYLVMEAAGCPICGKTEPHYHVGDGTDGSGYDEASAPVDNKLTIPRSVTMTVNGEETEIAVTAIAENAFKGLGLTVVVATDETTGAVITTADGNDRTLSVAPNADENGVISIPRSIDGIDITNLDADVFADKNAKVIDMSATTGLNLTNVDRTAGEEHPLGGIGVNTLVYLPAGLTPEEGSNTDNLVIGNDCSKLLLAEDMIIPKAFNASQVVFGREFKANRTSTIFLPFSISASQASSIGTFHTFTGITSDGKAQFSSAVSGEIASKTPYIFIPQADGKISVDADGGIAIAVTTGSEESTNGQLTGTFKAIEFGTEAGKVSPDGIYGFADVNDKNIAAGTFVKVKAGATIAPYRAYLEIANAGARLRFDVCFDDETTGISPVRVNADSYWYSIDGRRLTGKPTVKGTYINNGRKTIIK